MHGEDVHDLAGRPLGDSRKTKAHICLQQVYIYIYMFLFSHPSIHVIPRSTRIAWWMADTIGHGTVAVIGKVPEDSAVRLGPGRDWRDRQTETAGVLHHVT